MHFHVGAEKENQQWTIDFCIFFKIIFVALSYALSSILFSLPSWSVLPQWKCICSSLNIWSYNGPPVIIGFSFSFTIVITTEIQIKLGNMESKNLNEITAMSIICYSGVSYWSLWNFYRGEWKWFCFFCYNINWALTTIDTIITTLRKYGRPSIWTWK